MPGGKDRVSSERKKEGVYPEINLLRWVCLSVIYPSIISFCPCNKYLSALFSSTYTKIPCEG
jgi:hypothetical protein